MSLPQTRVLRTRQPVQYYPRPQMFNLIRSKSAEPSVRQSRRTIDSHHDHVGATRSDVPARRAIRSRVLHG